MIGWSDLLWGGVVPAVVAALMLAIVWRSTGKAASAWRTALVTGYIVGHWALDARDARNLYPDSFGIVTAILKSFRVTEARDWLPLLALLATAPDALACVGKRGPWLGWLLRVGLCLFVPWRLAQGTAYLPAMTLPDFGFATEAWSTGEAAGWIGGVGAVLLLGWIAVRAHHQQPDGASVRSALAVAVAVGGAITVVAAKSLIYGQMLGILTAALAGCGLAAMVLSSGRGPAAAAGPVVITFGSVLVIAHFFAELQIHNAVLLLLAMVLAIGWLPLPVNWSARWRAVCRTAVCLGVLAIQVIPAVFELTATIPKMESNPYQNFQP